MAQPEEATFAELERWVEHLRENLGLAGEATELSLVLDLARDAAHGIARPAAPLTTFLVGYAAGLRGGTPDDVASLSALASELASNWHSDS
jgi:uncharacterized protein (DUF849 family)